MQEQAYHFLWLNTHAEQLSNTETIFIWNSDESCIFATNRMIMIFSIEGKNLFCVGIGFEGDSTLATSPFGVNFVPPMRVLDYVILFLPRSHSCTYPDMFCKPRLRILSLVILDFFVNRFNCPLGALLLDPRLNCINLT